LRHKQSRPSRRLASLPEAAQYVGCSEKTLRRRVSDGSLPAYRLGPRLLRVDLADVDQLLLRRVPVGAA
jgi:excisionase family DNA binding protein